MSKSKLTHELGAAPDKDSAPSPVRDSGPPGAAGDSNRRLEMVPPGRLIADKRNARTHSQRQIGQIVRSIERFGFVNPVLIDEANQIIAGHGRVEAAKHLGLHQVPVLRVTHLSADERKAYALADNRLAELAGWDREILAIELQELRELDFDLAAIGFELDDVDIVGNAAEQTGSSQRTAPKTDRGASTPGCAVSRVGDLWLLGGHQLQCGIGTDDSYAAVDAAIRRWQRVAGKSATLAGAGRSFAAIAKERASGAGQDTGPRQPNAKREAA
jgi:ParB-like chromosome segregation protein Spo0J